MYSAYYWYRPGIAQKRFFSITKSHWNFVEFVFVKASFPFFSFQENKTKLFFSNQKLCLFTFGWSSSLRIYVIIYFLMCQLSLFLSLSSSSKVRVSVCVRACVCVCVLCVRSRSVYKTGAYILHQLNRKPQAEDLRKCSSKLSRFRKLPLSLFISGMQQTSE